MALLQKLAHNGHTVICSIHTPSAKIFQKFDHVFVITTGQCIYRGSASNLVTYLQSVHIECPRHYNLADFVIEISSGEHDFDLTERMIACMEMKAPILQVYRSKQDFELERKNYQRQLCFDHSSILMHKMMLQLCRNRDHLYLKIYLYVFLGFIIGGTFYDMGYDGSKSIYNLGFCFTTVLIFLYIPTLPILLWCKNNYDTFATLNECN
ncbi:PREDICTED: ATP-binding cassette sub-family G member 1-like [Dinoponera quadriceps]|uniref:ATP-binding cassette sub-family G member 1-like n=1 Tax=Dinoponera quadriceps TaxID=609295 RepID=A0A6P3Y5W3_DINQU|nr:PREDICTED: ATP-binding cassette sub-family G member 1-like [Dinoponera quadriceps]